MKSHPIGTKPAQKTPRRGFALGPLGLTYGYILPRETEISRVTARTSTANMIIMSDELHRQTQEIMALAT